MLRITQQDSSKGAKQYYAAADYYSEGQEIVGSWGGRAAHMLGLEGVVDQASFERLCDNQNPRTGEPLTVRTRWDLTVGYDFTFSVPKSVSLLYATTGDKELLGAFRTAVDETMRDIESEMKTRVRQKGENSERTTGNAVWAEFIHTTSRPVGGVPDPQLHAHCFVFNSTWDGKEQRWKAGQFRDLKRDAPYFQAAFRVRLAGKLQDMGYGIDRQRDDFEVTGVPASAIKRFSRRTEEIEKVAAEKGITDPRRKAELGAETREKKAKELSWYELRKEWRSRLTDKEREALAQQYRRQAPHARPLEGEPAAVDYAIAHSFVRETVVPERKLLTEVLKRGLGSVTVEGARRELSLRPLIRSQQSGQRMATTRDMLSAEERLIAFAKKGRGKCRPLGDGARPIHRERFNEEQKTAVRHVLGSRDVVTLVRGAAGTGKTTTVEAELRIAWAVAGVPVVAIAQSTGAVEEVREGAGFADAATVARFFKDVQMQASVRGGVVLVDEASQLGTKDMLRLFDIVQGAGARIVLVGDKGQHRSVNAGEPLKLLEKHAGLPVAEVTEIVRQVHDDYRKAAKALAEGHTAEAFAELDRLGWIKEVPHAGRYWMMGQAYLAAIREKNKEGNAKTALCVSPTHAEADRITRFIRDALKAAGKLGKEQTLDTWVSAQLTDAQKTDAVNIEAGDLLQFHQNVPGHKNGSRMVVAEGTALPLAYADRFQVFRPGKLTLAVGDRVRVTHNGRTKDGKHDLTNGALFSVQGFTKQGDVMVDSGWVIARDFGHLAHGYCVTSHAAQGKTVNKVFIGESSQSFGATNQRSFYVPVTRGKEQAVIFTDNKAELLRAVLRPDEPMSATDFVNNNKAAWRRRLGKHLASMRRAVSFARSHEPRERQPEKESVIERERSYAR